MKWFRFIVILAVFGMVGCATARPTITNTSNHEQEHTNLQSHNERLVDSTLIDRLREVIVRNDTVYIHDSIYIFKWRDRYVGDTIHDTLYIENTDTIYRPVEVKVPIEVEKPIRPFVRNSCIALWGIIGVAILALIIWLVWKFATGKFSWAKIGIKLLSIFK